MKEEKTKDKLSECTFEVTKLSSLLNSDHQRINLAKRRQAAVWRGEKPDKFPLLFNAPLTNEQEQIPAPNFQEAFYDPSLMLCSQVRIACQAANSKSDAVPSIRANLGTGTILSCLGLEQNIFPDKMPWLKTHLTKDQIAKLEPNDIEIKGTFERGLNYMRYFQEIMGETVAIYCMDTQGPFDLAHLMMGDDLFYTLYDDPPLVHHLMNICLELGIKTHTWMKEIIGEPGDHLYHSNAIYAENIGIRICEDTTSIISPDAIHEFAMPYTRKLAQHFGGAWAHYCGRNDCLTDALCEIPEIQGINFGGGGQPHNFPEDMQRCLKSSTISYQAWPRFKDESGKEYLNRLYKWSAQGCLIPSGTYALGEDNGFQTIQEALDYWYSLVH